MLFQEEEGRKDSKLLLGEKF